MAISVSASPRSCSVDWRFSWRASSISSLVLRGHPDGRPGVGDRLEGDDPRVLVLVLIGEAPASREASPASSYELRA
jgi:hypothetical protein